MRAKVIFGALLIGLLLVLFPLFFNGHDPGPPEKPISARLPGSTLPSGRQIDFNTISPGRPSAPSSAAADQEAGVQQALVELDEIFVAGGEQALSLVSAKLNHPDKRVRLAAVTNLVQLDDRAAIPALQQAAEQAVDADEKTNMLKAIEFLLLPSSFDPIARASSANTNAGHSVSTGKESQILRLPGQTNRSPRAAP